MESVDKLQIILERMEKSPKHPLPGKQDRGKPDKLGAIPPKREDIVSGKSGGHLEPDSDVGV